MPSTKAMMYRYEEADTVTAKSILISNDDVCRPADAASGTKGV